MGYLNRDKDRFAAADGDKDGKLNKTGIENILLERFLVMNYEIKRIWRFFAPRGVKENERYCDKRKLNKAVKFLL